MNLKRYIHTLAAILCLSLLVAQQIEVEADIDSAAIFIGEQATLTLKARQPNSAQLAFPIFSDNIIGKLELVETLPPDTAAIDGNNIEVTNRYKVTAFDSTLVYMPGFKIAHLDDTLTTNALTLKVYDMPVDTTQQAIADIKGIYKPPFDWIGLLTQIAIIVLSLVVIGIVAFIIYRVVKNNKKAAGEPEPIVDTRSAYEIAMQEINDLKEEKLWQAGKNKEYHSRLTDIVRQYIGRRFDIGAMELSSEDIMQYFRSDKKFRDMKTEIQLLDNILKLADLVKFAKMTPLANDNERAMAETVRFIELTKQDEPAETPKTDEPQSAAVDVLPEKES